MMANPKAKGRRVEKLACTQLEREGWLIEKQNPRKFQSNDFWNLFDIIAIKGDKTRLIQIKSNLNNFYTARKYIRAWIKKNEITIPCEVWVLIDESENEFRKEVITTPANP